jgi:hypothetical protein
MENLAALLHQEGRDSEAEPLFRDLLENLKRGVPQDETATLAVTKKLLSVVLGQMQMERQTPQSGNLRDRSVQADALVDEILAISARQSLAHPEKTLDSLKLAGFQYWLGRKAEYSVTYRGLMERAEQNPDDGYVIGHAAIAWCVDPSGDPNSRGQALRLAQNAVKFAKDAWEMAWVQRTLALTNYRAGNYSEAEKALIPASEATKHFDGSERNLKESFQASLDFIRSMILSRTGHMEEARTLFATGESEMKPLPPDDRQIFESNSAFHEVMVWLAYKEAKALLEGG